MLYPLSYAGGVDAKQANQLDSQLLDAVLVVRRNSSGFRLVRLATLRLPQFIALPDEDVQNRY